MKSVRNPRRALPFVLVSLGLVWCWHPHGAIAQAIFQFSTAKTNFVPARPAGMAIADLNGDGRPDIATAHYTGSFFDSSSGSLSVLLNNGDGTFLDGVGYPIDPYPWSMVLADVNNDSKLDMVSAAMWRGEIFVLPGNGDGTFQAPIYSGIFAPPFGGAGALYPRGVALGHLDGDQNIDAAVVNENGEGNGYALTVLFGDGTGQFRNPTNYLAVVGQALVLADFDQMRGLDIAVAGNLGSEISVLLNNGDGTFGPTTNFQTGGLMAQSIIAKDFNHDSFLDLATANNDSQSVSVLFGRAGGSFAEAVVYPIGDYARGLVAGDFNYDGETDLAVSAWGGTVILMKGARDGTFSVQDPITIGGVSFTVATADFDTNGTPDLVRAHYNGEKLNVLLNSTPPCLEIKGGGNQIVMSWPQLPGYALQACNTLLSGWTTVTNQIFTENGRNVFTNLTSSTAAFYRLYKSP